MNRTSKGLQIVVWSLLGAVLLLIAGLFLRAQLTKSNLPELGAVGPFTLTNQLGKTVTFDDLRGQVWVADVIFSRCGGPCPKMTEEMSRLQSAFGASDPLRFVTITTDPGFDTPEVLHRYAKRFKAESDRWYFLTGPKSEALQNLVTGSLKLAAVDKEAVLRTSDNDLFIHSTMFVLIDKHGKVRGYYESLEPGFQEKIKSDIESLLGEQG